MIDNYLALIAAIYRDMTIENALKLFGIDFEKYVEPEINIRKITNEDISAWRRIYDMGFSCEKIAETYEVDVSTVRGGLAND